MCLIELKHILNMFGLALVDDEFAPRWIRVTIVDRTTDHWFTAHELHFPCVPKKRGPDQWAPVMVRAMADKDL